MIYTTISYLNVLMSYVTSKSVTEQAMSKTELLGTEGEFPSPRMVFGTF